MLETERLFLRNFQMEDKDDCFLFMSDEQTCLDDGGYHAFLEQDEMYQQVMEKFLTEKHRYMIVEKESNRVIGTVNVMISEDSEQIASIGYVVSPQSRRRGYASEAVSEVIGHYFENTQINKFLATSFLYNQASIKVLQKLGFTCDGVIEMEIEHAELGKLDLLSYHLDSRSEK